MVKSLKLYWFGIITEVKLQANFKSDFLIPMRCCPLFSFVKYVQMRIFFFFTEHIFIFKTTQNSIFTKYSTKYTTSLLSYHVHSLHLSYMIHPRVNSIIFFIPFPPTIRHLSNKKQIKIMNILFIMISINVINIFFYSFYLRAQNTLSNLQRLNIFKMLAVVFNK